MGKKIRLTESELVRLIKKIINEDESAGALPEPQYGDSKIYKFFLFKSGSANPISVNKMPWNQNDKKSIIDEISKWFVDSGTLDVLRRFYRGTQFQIPPFITINVGTSSTGSPQKNSSVSEERFRYMYDIIKSALRKLMPEGGPNDEVIETFLKQNLSQTYNPTKIDANFADRTKVKADANEQYGELIINSLQIRGMAPGESRYVTTRMNQEPSKIQKYIKNRPWYSDFTDMFGVDSNEYGYKRVVDTGKLTELLLQMKSMSDLKDVDNLLQTSGKNLEGVINNMGLSCSQKKQIYNNFIDIAARTNKDQNIFNFDRNTCRVLLPNFWNYGEN